MKQVVQRFVGKKTVLGSAAMFTLTALVVVASLSGGPETGSGLLAQTSDALDRFIGRSPGERNDADVVKGKGKGKRKSGDITLGRAVEPTDRALGKIFDTPPEQALDELLPDTEELVTPGEVLPPGLLPGDQLALTPAPIAPPFVGGFPGGVGVVTPTNPGGGGPGNPGPGPGVPGPGPGVPGNPDVPGPGNPGNPPGPGPGPGNPGGGIIIPTTPPVPVPPVIVPPVVSPVPEPATWALMLLGFAMAGGAMRRGKPATHTCLKDTPSCV